MIKIGIILLPLLLSIACSADEIKNTVSVPEYVVIDNHNYLVPEQWQGKKIDTTQMPNPKDLVQIPDENTFEDYRIYVRRETRNAFLFMVQAAAKDSIYFIVDSGYRSIAFQRRIILRRLKKGDDFGRIVKMVAPPGYSEHHTGYALDFCPSKAKFAYTATYQWLSENAGQFGFVQSLPEEDNNTTYWESWHWVYKGHDKDN